MKRIRIVLILTAVMLFIGSAAVFAGGGDWYIGDRVFVDWSGDSYWYPATIVDMADGEYFVVFDDGDREWVYEDAIYPDDLGEGDRIEGNWQGGGVYYPGVIAERIGDAVYIEYDDGDVETTTIGHVRVE